MGGFSAFLGKQIMNLGDASVQQECVQREEFRARIAMELRLLSGLPGRRWSAIALGAAAWKKVVGLGRRDGLPFSNQVDFPVL